VEKKSARETTVLGTMSGRSPLIFLRMPGQARRFRVEQLAQRQLKDHRFCLATKSKICIQLHAVRLLFETADDIARFGFHLARLADKLLQGGFSLLAIFVQVTPAGCAVGVIHDSTDIHTATGGGFVGATFIDGVGHKILRLAAARGGLKVIMLLFYACPFFLSGDSVNKRHPVMKIKDKFDLKQARLNAACCDSQVFVKQIAFY
jgi:hypothetical protein